jgi:nucleotide-binding universal stress UspA family protein
MYKKILVPIDGSATSGRGFEEAVALARAVGASLRLMHVVDTVPVAMEMAPSATWLQVCDEQRRDGEALIERARATAIEHGVAVDSYLLEGSAARVADAIVEEARAADCDLIVMGTHGRRGFSHLMMGSDAERVARISPLPVLLVRHPEAHAA